MRKRRSAHILEIGRECRSCVLFFQYFKIPPSLDVQTLHHNKYIVKSMVEYSSTHRSLSGDEFFTIREDMFKVDHVVHSQLSYPVFGSLRQYVLKEAHILCFRSISLLQLNRENLQEVRLADISKLLFVSISIVLCTLQDRRQQSLVKLINVQYEKAHTLYSKR